MKKNQFFLESQIFFFHKTFLLKIYLLFLIHHYVNYQNIKFSLSYCPSMRQQDNNLNGIVQIKQKIIIYFKFLSHL
jgi:hypothetical protein